jgi:hypothetical protein
LWIQQRREPAEGQRATSTEQTNRKFARVVAWAELCAEGLQPDDVANGKSIHAEMRSRGALLTGLSLSFLEAQSVKTSIEGLWGKCRSEKKIYLLIQRQHLHAFI